MSALVTTAAAIDTARSFFEAYDSHDLNRMLLACADNAQVRYVPMGSDGFGRADIVGREIWSGLISAFPDLSVTIQSIFTDARNVAAEVTIAGTQDKDFLDIRNRGKRYELPHAFLLKLSSEDLITSITAYWDNASFYRQLGKTKLDD